VNVFHRIGQLPWVARVLVIGVVDGDSEALRIQKAIVNMGVLWGILPIHVLFLASNLWFKEMWLVAVDMGVLVCSLVSFLVFAHTKRHFERYKRVQLAIAFLSPFLVTLIMGGLSHNANVLLYGLVGPIFALLLYEPRKAFYGFLLSCGLTVICWVAQPWLRTQNNFPPDALLMGSVVNIMIVSGLVFIALLYFMEQRNTAYRMLNLEKEKSEALLLNILPKDIADYLKVEQRVIADHFDSASILFADVVGFTKISANMNPMQLVEMLNSVFTHFDAMVEKYGVEKIKTIGDCYMAASGIPRERHDHAHALARLALDIQQYVAQNPFGGLPLRFRIGINSGPVVAGVIGSKKFIYDLWGDAVNVASRMESHGNAGEIQITRETYELIKGDFICEPRGSVHIKGKGNMDVWCLVGAKNPANELSFAL
jgi:guanylate cyclase